MCFRYAPTMNIPQRRDARDDIDIDKIATVRML